MRKEYMVSDFSSFVVTGKLRNGKRFRDEYSNYYHANGINMWNGRLWGILKETNKRVLLKTVSN